MATNKKNAPNIDQSNLTDYPDGRIRDNSGAGDGTPVNRLVYGDLHEFFAKMMRLAEISYNGLPDNETNGYQLIDALTQLANKNNILYTVNSVGGVLAVSFKLSILKDGEIMVCRAGTNYASEPQIKGPGILTLNVTTSTNYKANDYLLLVKNSSGINIVRLADADNIDVLVASANFLKAATELEEYAGVSTAKATTPYTNQLAFARRVIGLDSGLFLATTLRNGLLSKEDKALINGLNNPVKNVGWFSGLDIGEISQLGTSLPRYGNVVSAVVSSVVGFNTSVVLVTMQNAMVANNYFVRSFIQSEGTLTADNNLICPVFKTVSNTQFLICLEEYEHPVQNLKIHVEVVQIS
jgi:hypothetical protein